VRRKIRTKKPNRHKTKLGLPDLEHVKSAVLVSLRSPESQWSYRHPIEDFVSWYCSEPRLSFNKTVVTRYRIHLEDKLLAPGTINVRLGLHSLRRFRTETLRRARVPEDLTKLWLGHSKEGVTDYAGGLQNDPAWRQEWCERAELGFGLGGHERLNNLSEQKQRN
jgi:hypothetical protein